MDLLRESEEAIDFSMRRQSTRQIKRTKSDDEILTDLGESKIESPDGDFILFDRK